MTDTPLDLTPPDPAPPAPAVSPWAPVLALVERSGWQAVQVALGAVLLGLSSGALDYEAGQVAILAGIAAGLTVLANGIPSLDLATSNPTAALVLRAVRSFVSAFLAPIVGLAVLPTDVGTWQAAALGAVVAALAVIKGAIAEHVGAQTPATLPASLDLAA